MNTGQPTHLFKVEETNQSKSTCHTERRNRRQIMWAGPRPTVASVVETVLFFQPLKVLIMFSYTPHTCLPSFTPLNSPDRSRCSMVVLFRQKPRAKHHRTLFLAKALGVRGVRWFGPFWPNPSTGRLDGLFGSFMSVWAHQNPRKYPLEGFLGCVLSS